MRLSGFGGLLLALGLVAGCGTASGTPGPRATPSSASATATVTVRVVVDTKNNPCMEELPPKPGTCYLPIYSRPTFAGPSVPVNSAPGSKCTPEDEHLCWPQPGTELKAVCKLDGLYVQDSVGRGSATWYAVIVPPGELLIDRTLLPSTREDEVVGFAPAIWLRQLTQQEVPSCEGVIAYG